MRSVLPAGLAPEEVTNHRQSGSTGIERVGRAALPLSPPGRRASRPPPPLPPTRQLAQWAGWSPPHRAAVVPPTGPQGRASGRMSTASGWESRDTSESEPTSAARAAAARPCAFAAGSRLSRRRRLPAILPTLRTLRARRRLTLSDHRTDRRRVVGLYAFCACKIRGF